MRLFLARAFEAYGQLVKQRPFLSQLGTAGILVTTADVIAQTIVERKKKFEFKRTLVMAACGFMYIGPIVGMWFSALNRWGFNAVINVALDQAIAAPLLISGFFFLQSVLMGKGWRAGKHRIFHELPTVYKVNVLVWVPAQLINFQLVPFQYRMLFAQTVALFWNCYLSNRANRVSQVKESTEPA